MLVFPTVYIKETKFCYLRHTDWMAKIIICQCSLFWVHFSFWSLQKKTTDDSQLTIFKFAI